MNNDKIADIVIKFIENDYKYAYSFEYDDNNYDNIVNYWNEYYISQMNKDLLNFFDIKTNVLSSKILDELNIIFSAHYNSSDNHMVIFYISHLDYLIIKLKYEDAEESIMPFWTIKISSAKISNYMKLLNIKKNELAILVYN